MRMSRPHPTPLQQFPKFSTVPLEDLWWRAKINAEDVRWVQRNLGHDLDGQARFPTIPPSVGTAMAVYPGCPWDERVEFADGERAPRVLIELGNPYNYRLEYSKARQKRDPQLSPHGLFRQLEPDYHKHAFQFMQQFGPLFIDAPTRLPSETLRVRLGDFWDRHARFVAVAKLWEDRFDPEKLRADWGSMAEQHERLNRGGPAPLGNIPGPPHKYVRVCPKLPWERESYEKDVLRSNDYLRQLVYELLRSELILHTQDCVQTWTVNPVPDDEEGYDVQFEPIRSFTSLWSAIWELFGLDTRQYGWKLCRLCGHMFYPKDRRSVCCCTDHQSLWSKREWARHHRGSERNRREERQKNHRMNR